MRRSLFVLSVFLLALSPAIGSALPVFVSVDGTDNGVFAAEPNTSYSVDVFYNLDSDGAGGAYSYTAYFSSTANVVITGFSPSPDVHLWTLPSSNRLGVSGGDPINGQSGTYLMGTLDFDSGALEAGTIGTVTHFLGFDYSTNAIVFDLIHVTNPVAPSMPVPEPGTMLMLFSGLLSLSLSKRHNLNKDSIRRQEYKGAGGAPLSG